MGYRVAERFYLDTVLHLLDEGWLEASSSVLVVAGSNVDYEVLRAAGLGDVTISNLDERMAGDEFRPYRWSFEDAEQLSFGDDTFDACLVHQGLHHCRSPHRALLEMYRVARRGIVVFEPQETSITRLGVRLGLGQEYEHAAVRDHGLRFGGVQNSAVPNYVYRWTEREIRKVLATNDPVGRPQLRCFRDLRLPEGRIQSVRSRPARSLLRAALPVVRAGFRVFPRQANTLAVVADKLDSHGDLHPWLTTCDNRPVPDARWFASRTGTPA